MKQVLQNLRDGGTSLVEVPIPMVSPGQVLIRTSKSLVSTGTERMLVEFGRAGYLGKAKQQPEKVQMVLDKIRSEGLFSTYEAITSKLDQEIPLGYSNVGEIVEVGEGVRGLAIGDRVVSNGPHAEYVCVGQNLVARIPEDVDDETASFAVAASIGLQGIRLAEPTLGEKFVVFGLGLIGLLSVQILRANGCSVLGIDVSEEKLLLAAEYGAETMLAADEKAVLERARAFAGVSGVDGVIITASAKHDRIVHQAAQMSRKRGRIVLVGVVNLALNRADFYEKELTFQVSCSYGPGRYDPTYESKGRDYPLPFVRWTEQRNFEAVLGLMSAGMLNIRQLVSRKFELAAAADAYEFLSSDSAALGIVINYPKGETISRRVVIEESRQVERKPPSSVVIGALGAGNYASRILIPALKNSDATLKTIVTSSGVNGTVIGSKFGFCESSTDPRDIFDDEEINCVIVATRHDSHASYVIDAIKSGKSVFVEKPLAIRRSDIDRIESQLATFSDPVKRPILMVGFNRRFAPFVQSLKREVLSRHVPVSIVYDCNAGAVDEGSWVHDIDVGGGRIVGEACHFIDLCRYITGSSIADFHVVSLTHGTGSTDTATISLSFEDGSIAVVNYFANGHRSFPKERISVYQDGRIHVIDNFKSYKNFGGTGKSRWLWRADRGQKACVQSFLEAVLRGQESPIALDEVIEISRVAIEAELKVRGKV